MLIIQNEHLINTKAKGGAKQLLHTKLYNKTSFYCDRPYKQHKKSPDRKCYEKDCSLNINKGKELQKNTIDSEHIVPRSTLGKKSPDYKLSQSDLHNLRPTVAILNNQRQNYPFIDNINSPHIEISKCDLKITHKAKLVSPPNSKKGTIARTYLYMNDTYSLQLSEQELEQYLRWHKLYPPNNWEIKRNILIQKYQGNTNPWIDIYETKK